MPKRVACFLLVAGLWLIVGAVLLSARDSRVVTRPPGIGRSSPSSVTPSAGAVASYAVAPDHPKYIDIPAIRVPTTRIMQLGLTRSNEIAVPLNIHDAGWYNHSAKPGQPGAMFIYGHVSSWQARGVFYNLKKLKPGDLVKVTDGANRTFVYKVIGSKTYPYNAVNMDEVLSPADSRPGLNLMTCAGRIVKGTSEFNERLVVFTSLAER